MSANPRAELALSGLFHLLKKTIGFTQHLGLTTLPRGGMQLVVSSLSDDALLRSYLSGFDSLDYLTWRAISTDEPVLAGDVWPEGERDQTAYWRVFMTPHGLDHAVCFPLSSPLLAGYPGAIHLCRKSSDGAFSAAEIAGAQRVIKDFESRLRAARLPAKSSHAVGADPNGSAPATSSMFVLDAELRPILHQGDWSLVDGHLRHQFVEQAKRRMLQLNGEDSLTDRVQFPDSHGNVLIFRVITYKRYPALGDGPISVFCPQPTCHDWGNLQAADFQADEELARLIPAIRFMQEKFRSGPGLEAIAGAAELSPFHFHRRFSKLLGLTPKQFLLECQIDQAKGELLAGQKELSQIAEDCGFAHQSHFTSRFKQATGLTPTRWRRLMGGHVETSEN